MAPGKPLRGVISAAIVVLIILLIVVALAIGSAELYGIYLRR